METLAYGDHTVKALFDDGAGEATFAIALGKAKPSTSVNMKMKALNVSWKKVKGAKKYQVQWRVYGGKWKSKYVKSTKVTLEGMKAGKLYDFRVRAVSGNAKEAWSAQTHRWFAKLAGVKTSSKKPGVKEQSTGFQATGKILKAA